MRHWNSRIGWPGDGRGDSRHNFKLNSRINGCLCLFRATPKNKRIAALQSDDLFPFACFLDQERVDFLLAQRVFARSFSSVNHLRVVSRPPENLRTCQMIINDHVRLLDAFLRPQRNETEIARPRANKKNFASLRSSCHRFVRPEWIARSVARCQAHVASPPFLASSKELLDSSPSLDLL